MKDKTYYSCKDVLMKENIQSILSIDLSKAFLKINIAMLYSKATIFIVFDVHSLKSTDKMLEHFFCINACSQ